MSTTIIAIGDELLGGFVLDTNSRWMAQRLRALGHPLKRISVVSDRPHEIVDQVRRDLADPDVDRIFTDGGLGPTPDDRTFEAMGLALGRELVVWPDVRDRIEDRVRRIMAWQGVGQKEAERLCRDHDDERAHYVRHFYGRDISDPLLYDAVLNTSRLGLDAAASVAVAVAKKKLGLP